MGLKQNRGASKKWAAILLAGSLASGAFAQTETDSSYNGPYYQGRMEIFNTLPATKNAIVFLGNSITERAQWQELLPGLPVQNRGIGGDNTYGVLARLDVILAAKPRKIFLDIGINDIGSYRSLEVITRNYRRIIEKIRSGSPGTALYLQSVLPMNDSVLTAEYLKNKKTTILEMNIRIRELADKYGLTYVNLHKDVFSDNNGDLKKELTADGIHLRPAAYVLWVAYLKKKKYL